MRVALTVRFPELAIVRAEEVMAAHPYGVGTDALPPLEGLVGVSVAHGFTRVLNERFGRQLGCSHLTALIQALAPVVRQAAGAAFVEKKCAPPNPGERWFINTWPAWREGGPLHTLSRGATPRSCAPPDARRSRPAGAGRITVQPRSTRGITQRRGPRTKATLPLSASSTRRCRS